MKNYAMLRIMHVLAISALLAACNKNPYLSMGNVSSSDDDGSSIVHMHRYTNPVYMKRDKIARIAESYIGSVQWAFDRSKGNFPAGKPKCNKFVYDVLLEAAACPLSNRDSRNGRSWPIMAADWATDNYTMLGWRNMGSNASWQRGDVIAERRNYTNASGHCGIAVSRDEVVAAGTYQVSRGNHDLLEGAVVRYWGVGRD